MSTIHPHWQSTDDAPVPVPVRTAIRPGGRVAPRKNVPVLPVGATTISRRPAAVVGILLTLSIGAVAYGTLDDVNGNLAQVREAEMTNVSLETPPEEPAPMEEASPTEEAGEKNYFDIITEEMVEEQMQEEISEEPVLPAKNLQPSVPVNTSAYNAPPAGIPANQHTQAASVFEPVHSGAPRQPETGAEMLWVTLLGAMAGLLWKSREMLKAIS